MTLLKLSLLSALFGEPNLERLLLGEVNDCKASGPDQHVGHTDKHRFNFQRLQSGHLGTTASGRIPEVRLILPRVRFRPHCGLPLSIEFKPTADHFCRSAVTSISIFMRGSSKLAEIIMAAGRTSPKYLRKTAQHCSNSEPLGST